MSKNIQLSEASSLPQYVEDGTLNQLPPVNGTAKPSFCGKVASCMRSVGTDIKRMFFCCSQQADSSDDQLLDSQQFEHIHHEGNEDFDADPYVLSDED